MKRFCFLIAAVCMPVVSALAGEKYFMMNNEIYPCAVPASELQAVGYVDSAKTLTLKYKDGRCVWSTGIIESIDVTESPCETLFSSDADADILSLAAWSDRTPSVKELVPTDKDDPEYEDFIENFARSYKVTVTFDGNRASVTVLPSNDNIKYTVSRSNVVLDINDKKVQVIVQGSSDNGSLKIYSEYKFRLDLNNLTLNNNEGPAVNIQSKKRVYFNLPEGSKNLLKSGDEFKTQYAPDGTEEDAKATLFSEGQLIFSGPGSMDILNTSHHGICSDDYIRFRSTLGSITVVADKDAIHTKDYFRMYGGVLATIAGDNSVQVENGDVSFFHGYASVSSTDHGILAQSDSLPVGTVNVYGQAILVSVSEERSAVSCQDGFFADGGCVMFYVKSSGSRGIKSDSKIVLKNGIAAAELLGCIPAWNAESMDYTQPAAFRAKDSILIENAVVFCETEPGTMGAKIVNSDSSVVMSKSTVVIDSEQEDYTAGESVVKAKAIEGDNILIDNRSAVFIKSNRRMISADSDFEINNSVLKLTSDFSESELLKYKNQIINRSAVFYNKLTVE